VNEDAIESIIALMRNHIGRNVIPALSGTGHLASYSTNKKDQQPVPPLNKKQQHKTGQSEPVSKAKQSKANKNTQQALIKDLKKIYKPITSTVGLLTNLIERLDLLIQSVAVEDQPLLSICSSALSSLTIDPATTTDDTVSLTHSIQTTAMCLIATVFRKYPPHRIVILEDLFPLFLKIPTSKKSIRTFAVRVGNQSSSLKPSMAKKQTSSALVTPHGASAGDGQAFIQGISALLLSMIQACVTMPLVTQIPQADDDESNDKNNSKRPRLTSGLQECERTCKIFTTLLVQRCSKKGADGGGASEFRPVLSNLVEDLLLVQMLPEFPAAEMLLMEICRKLCDDLLANSAVRASKKSASSEATYLTTAMDTIGTICSDVAAKISWARESPLVFPKAVDMDTINEDADPSSDSKEINRCFCGRAGLVDTFMLDCDRCHNWFHGSCVGIAKDNLPDMWVCDECTMQLLVLDQMKIFSSKYGREGIALDEGVDELSNEDKVHVMRILLLNFLSHQERLTGSSFSKLTRHFHLAKFVKDTEALRGTSNEGLLLANANVICAHYLDLWNSNDGSSDRSGGVAQLTNTSRSNQHCEYLSEEGNGKLMLTLNASKSQLVASFPQLLGVIIALMGDENIVSLRKLAVKALSQIVQVDTSLMSKREIRDAVAKRFKDEAISVREAAVSLVGFYVLQAPELAKSFHTPLLFRLNDNGISVVRTLNRFRF